MPLRPKLAKLRLIYRAGRLNASDLAIKSGSTCKTLPPTRYAKYTIGRIVSLDVVKLLNLPSGVYNRFNVNLLRRATNNPVPS
ncbi:hypothetical protein L249_2620 [Ophiocordyceps polyrhachis-furcata BCC 54312]|uniref:Uncharacterized protein n=1 Tax=Ophiocordyceps polyrhachis-furcata BCC 54312 TaxID=1330021 RepID=A0A367LNV3_9HYPO|nr:hypothetical protein L249_2620 [Ophiocordyceps polyrhachis-furcata BCC 54312]